jgi:cell shape-determining protein MreC
MGDVVYFDKARVKTLVKETKERDDLNERIERIKANIARINQLMAELREVK